MPHKTRRRWKTTYEISLWLSLLVWAGRGDVAELVDVPNYPTIRWPSGRVGLSPTIATLPFARGHHSQAH